MTRRCAGIGRMAQAIPGGRRSATCTKLRSSNGDPVEVVAGNLKASCVSLRQPKGSHHNGMACGVITAKDVRATHEGRV